MVIQEGSSELVQYFKGVEKSLRTHRCRVESALHEYLDYVRSSLLDSADTRRQKEERLAPDFAILPYIELDENRLSQITRDLLDPNGNHGQGAAFLQCFLKQIGRSQTVPSNVKVTCEDPAVYCADFRSRIDITIDFGHHGIGIENKPWASEGKWQLKRYAEHLDKKYSGKYVLVFISRDGGPPRSLPAAELSAMRVRHNFKILSYSRDLPRWLEECRSRCKASHVRWFLRDLQSYLNQEFGTFSNLQGAQYGANDRN